MKLAGAQPSNPRPSTAAAPLGKTEALPFERDGISFVADPTTR